MDGFWKWLSAANARGVLYCLIAGLIVVIGWWVWRELNPGIVKARVPAARSANEAPAVPGLVQFFRQVTAPATNQYAGNPFYRYVKPENPQPTGGEATSVGPKPALPPTPVPPQQPIPPPKPVVKTVVLIYRGMIEKADGTRIAMVENLNTRQTKPIPRDGLLVGRKVGAIDSKELQLMGRDGSMSMLPVGQSKELIEE